MKTIGILGGGQLAQLIAQCADKNDFKVLCFVDNENCPAKRYSPLFVGDLSNDMDLKKFAEQVDVITLENETIDVETLKKLAQLKPVYPSADVIEITQDRLLEKQYVHSLDILTTNFAAIDSADDLLDAIKTFGSNGILKTRRLGYDGKGQVRIKNDTDCYAAWDVVQQPAIFETFVNFTSEVSILAARNIKGDTIFYPLIENYHEAGILRRSRFCDSTNLQKQAEKIAIKLVSSLQYVGLMAIEFFVLDNHLMVNEIAPRVHNSGHLTIEGSNVSQFEQHARAVLGRDLMTPIIKQSVEMINVIGEWPKGLDQFQHIYDYGKIARKNRKLGHLVRNIS